MWACAWAGEGVLEAVREQGPVEPVGADEGGGSEWGAQGGAGQRDRIMDFVPCQGVSVLFEGSEEPMANVRGVK